jgi:hypothetical protein
MEQTHAITDGVMWPQLNVQSKLKWNERTTWRLSAPSCCIAFQYGAGIGQINTK